MPAGPIPGSNGGTGIDNGNRTMTLNGGNITLNLGSNADLSLPGGTHTIPTSTGLGATGTWPINVSGSAGSASTTFQQTYNNGIAGGIPGWCQIDPGKPFIIQNFAFGTDQETFGVATSKQPGLGSNRFGYNFYGFDGASSFINFGRIEVENVVRTPAAEYGTMGFKSVLNGTLKQWLFYDSQTDIASFDSIVTVPQNLTYSTNITSNATRPVHRVRIVANEAIAVGEILKVSSTVDFRVEKVKTGDATTIPIVGVAATASAAAGDLIEVYGMTVFPVITNSVTTRGNLLSRSAAVSGRVTVSAAAVGVFAVALQNGAVGGTILAALKWSESF